MKILFSSLFLILSVSAAFACTCTNTANITYEEHSKYLKNVKAIFYGEVVSVGERNISELVSNQDTRFWDYYRPVKFKVFRAWKGIENTEITVLADLESSCKYPLKAGDKLMVYAFTSPIPNIPVSINYCSDCGKRLAARRS